jgi:hypothetical protein
VHMQEFIWNRTRSIRNDFSILQLSNVADFRLQIECYERIARFHIVSMHLMSRQGSQWLENNHQPEYEQFSNTLKTLRDLYSKVAHSFHSPNELEFRSYEVVVGMMENPDSEYPVQASARYQTSPETVNNPNLQSAFNIVATAANTLDVFGPINPKVAAELAQQNAARFWAIIKSPQISYLLACCAELSLFNMVRRITLRNLWTAYRQTKTTDIDAFTVPLLAEMLGFDHEDEVQPFCKLFGFDFKDKDGTVYLDLSSKQGSYFPRYPPGLAKQLRSDRIVEPKRRGRYLSAVINGLTVQQASENGLIGEKGSSIALHPESADESTLFVTGYSDDDDDMGDETDQDYGEEVKVDNQNKIAATPPASILNPFASPFHPGRPASSGLNLGTFNPKPLNESPFATTSAPTNMRTTWDQATPISFGKPSNILQVQEEKPSLSNEPSNSDSYNVKEQFASQISETPSESTGSPVSMLQHVTDSKQIQPASEVKMNPFGFPVSTNSELPSDMSDAQKERHFSFPATTLGNLPNASKSIPALRQEDPEKPDLQNRSGPHEPTNRSFSTSASAPSRPFVSTELQPPTPQIIVQPPSTQTSREPTPIGSTDLSASEVTTKPTNNPSDKFNEHTGQLGRPGLRNSTTASFEPRKVSSMPVATAPLPSKVPSSVDLRAVAREKIYTSLARDLTVNCERNVLEQYILYEAEKAFEWASEKLLEEELEEKAVNFRQRYLKMKYLRKWFYLVKSRRSKRRGQQRRRRLAKQRASLDAQRWSVDASSQGTEEITTQQGSPTPIEPAKPTPSDTMPPPPKPLSSPRLEMPSKMSSQTVGGYPPIHLIMSDSSDYSLASEQPIAGSSTVVPMQRRGIVNTTETDYWRKKAAAVARKEHRAGSKRRRNMEDDGSSEDGSVSITVKTRKRLHSVASSVGIRRDRKEETPINELAETMDDVDLRDKSLFARLKRVKQRFATAASTSMSRDVTPSVPTASLLQHRLHTPEARKIAQQLEEATGDLRRMRHSLDEEDIGHFQRTTEQHEPRHGFHRSLGASVGKMANSVLNGESKKRPSTASIEIKDDRPAYWGRTSRFLSRDMYGKSTLDKNRVKFTPAMIDQELYQRELQRQQDADFRASVASYASSQATSEITDDSLFEPSFQAAQQPQTQNTNHTPDPAPTKGGTSWDDAIEL